MKRKDVDPKKMRELESSARGVGEVIGAAVNQDPNRRIGFVLFLFDFDGPEMTYIANAVRSDVVKTLQEFIARNPPEKTWDQQQGER